MVGVQAEGCAPIAKAFEAGEVQVKAWNEPKTIASGIADPLQGYPEDGSRTLCIIRRSDGYACACSDNEILEAAMQLAKEEAVFAEPSGAASIAGFKMLIEEGKIDRNDTVICVITGHGLKEPNAFSQYYSKPPVIRPNLKELDRALQAVTTCKA